VSGSSGDLLDEVGDARGVVLHGKRSLEDVAVTVANECDVFALGVVEGDAENLGGVSGAFEDGADEGVLVAIDRLDLAGCFHGTVRMPC